MTHMRRTALVIAAVLAFLTLAVPAIHHHDSEFGSARAGCYACAWTQTAGTGVLTALPVTLSLLFLGFAVLSQSKPSSRNFDPASGIRGPPSPSF